MNRTPLLAKLKYIGKALIARAGYDIQRRSSMLRAASDMPFMLESLKQRGFKPDWILDVGANRGEWSRMAKTVFPNAHCFLIEPQIEMQPDLEKFCQDFPGSQWQLAGAGAELGELSLTVWGDLAGSSFLPSLHPERAAIANQRVVPIVTIDQLLNDQKLSIPQLVKLDIQGFELEALKGASQLWDQVEVFILEVSLFEFLPGQPVFDQVIEFMRHHGYVVYDFPGFCCRPFDGALGQCDVCFVQVNGFFRTSASWN
ncbi:MAG TPA: FkbM family methyltransferase [Leptolyngbya sp.]|jgi:FkbM family methyltransferase|nr:FkbM family methyltransferase [Leptolyngbya sp.]